jgi:serine protease Do
VVLAACAPGSPGGRLFVDQPEPPPPRIEAPAPLPAFDPQGDPIVEVVERVRPAVVNVVSDLGGGQDAEGTGFIVRSDGVVVTNYHVVGGAIPSGVTVITEGGERYTATPIGGLADSDLAVLQIDGDDLPTVSLGNSDELKLGETVVAVGFALGLDGGPTVTSGIVSALNRTIDAGGSGSSSLTYEGIIQTDAAINPGNSGGPLVDMSGRVVGINTAGVQAGQAENIGFAIAVNRARPIIEHAINDPQGPVAYLGVSTQDVTPLVAARFGLPVDRGALVREVVPDTPAARAGMQREDVIVAIGGVEVASSDGVLERLLEHDPGQEVTVTVVRGEQTVDLDVTLGTRASPVG